MCLSTGEREAAWLAGVVHRVESKIAVGLSEEVEVLPWSTGTSCVPPERSLRRVYSGLGIRSALVWKPLLCLQLTASPVPSYF